jgi:segregation and condensation protein B
MKADELTCAVEAILTVALEPVPIETLCDVCCVSRQEVEAALGEIQRDLAEGERGFLLVELGSGWRLQTNPSVVSAVQRFAQRDVSARLSTAALETLAIVAYRQPVTRAQIAALRGVNVDGVVRLLEQRGYIEPVGQAEGPGQAVLYATSDLFLDRLGLSSLEQLPKPETLLPDEEEAARLADELAEAPST